MKKQLDVNRQAVFPQPFIVITENEGIVQSPENVFL